MVINIALQKTTSIFFLCSFCAQKMLAVLAYETSVIIQFNLTQLLCYIPPEERAAIEVKITLLELSQTFHLNENALFAVRRAILFIVCLHHLESLF